jgi:hypothetical protein
MTASFTGEVEGNVSVPSAVPRVSGPLPISAAQISHRQNAPDLGEALGGGHVIGGEGGHRAIVVVTIEDDRDGPRPKDKSLG